MTRYLLSLILSFVTVVAAASDLSREDFAFQAPLTSTSSGSLLRAPLTLEVYRSVSRPDLADIRAYNAAGEMLAHAIERPVTEITKTLMPLPLFRVLVPGNTTVEQSTYQVRQDRNGAIVAVRTHSARAGDKAVYLVDASRLREPFIALQVEWNGPTSEFMAAMNVEGSQDLKSWQSITQGVLARLSRDGGTLHQQRIELPGASKSKYLRLSWANPDPGHDVAVTHVKAEIRKDTAPAREWLEVDGIAGSVSGEYRYASAGMIPVDRIRVLIPSNTVARVELLSRVKDGAPWVRRGDKTVFRVGQGGTQVADDEISVPRIIGHQWLLRIAKQGNGIGGQSPRLSFGWVPDQVVVLSRGEPPYMLAFGRAQTPPPDFGVDELVRRSRQADGERVEVAETKLGAAEALRGEAALGTAWYQRNWKQRLLWFVLVTGVVILAIVAARLLRHTQNQ